MRILAFLMIMSIFIACAEEKNQNADNSPIDQSENGLILRNPIQLDGTIDSSILAIISYNEEVFNFDSIQEGEIVKHDFSFKNEGKAALKIMNITPSCGCTSTEYSDGVIAPGETGKIQVSFDTNGRTGKQNKPITVSTNSVPSISTIKMEGYVIPKK